MENTIISKYYSAIILSAGRSSRMGVPKFSLQFDDNITFLENLVYEYSTFGCREIVVVMNIDGFSLLSQLNIKLPDSATVVVNQHPEWERFYSLKLAAKALKDIKPVFVSNIDNPFVNHKLLDSLSNSRSGADYINPVYNGRGGHPFLLSEKVVADLRVEEKDQIHLKEFLGQYSKKSVEVDDEKILLNINTDEDFREYIHSL